ncbi:MAG: protein kinase [Bacteroidales bacterium]|nr:protein kinase [Bacteroidales bacterium]
MRFTYRSGQRPLDGYTIKRGVGRGGFGEVYFAVSDGGKEVALKFLRGHTEIELRGVASCLNLKHPNLVHVYDLKSDSLGETWLVMEYVLGESMAQVIERHPHGLPLNLTKEWFVNLSRAVGFLHDHGVVHRDLKPANIFVENGTLKVGDYGLCKALGSSQRQQTRAVGTVHYMAPEISTGNYSRAIDIYACGVILHEMLTGQLPFEGESDGEILMKHLTATPDLSRVPTAFRDVVAKALDKNPVRRFSSMAEFARAVEAATALSSPALPVPAVAPVPGGQPGVPTQSYHPSPPSVAPVVSPVPEALPNAIPVTVPAVASSRTTRRDRLVDWSGALLRAPLYTVLGIVPYAVVTSTVDVSRLGDLFLLSVALSWAIILGSAGTDTRTADSWERRFRLGGLGLLVGMLAFWLDGWHLPRLASPMAGAGQRYVFGLFQMDTETASAAWHYLLYFGGVLTAGRWWLMAVKDRKDRLGLFPLIAMGFWGGLLVFLWPWMAGSPVAGGIVPLVIAAFAVQLASPWIEPPPPLPRKLRWRA